MNGEIALRVEDIHAGYLPGIDILRGITLEAHPNAVSLIIGPNGAGKSTLLRTIFGFLRWSHGNITLHGSSTSGWGPSDLKAHGVSYVPQDINSFPSLTVEENLQMGGWVFRRDKARLRRQLERAYDTFPVLAERRHAAAGQLSGGQGRTLSIAREMMTEPVVLLIDEPTVGLAPNMVDQVYDVMLAAKKSSQMAILLVEQNVEQALPFADYLYLLNLGRVKAEGFGREFDGMRIQGLIQECLLG